MPRHKSILPMQDIAHDAPARCPGFARSPQYPVVGFARPHAVGPPQLEPVVDEMHHRFRAGRHHVAEQKWIADALRHHRGGAGTERANAAACSSVQTAASTLEKSGGVR